jgi:hypothetical protein
MKKQKRYRQRQYLRKAITRTTLRLCRNAVLGIEPDEQTALLAGVLVFHLRWYLYKAKMAEPGAPDDDNTQLMKLSATIKRETAARYRFPQRARGPKRRRGRV